MLGNSVILQKPSSSAVSSTSTNGTPKRPYSADKNDTHSPPRSPLARKSVKLKGRKEPKTERDNLEEDANISTSSQTSRHSSPLSLKPMNISMQRQYLPPAFSLLASVHVPITVTSAEIMEMCKLRKTNPEAYQPIFDEHFPPPKPPVVPNGKLSKEKVF